MAYSASRGFTAIGFRSNGERNNYEEFYFRAHRSGFRDTIQYTPVEHGNAAWQIFTDNNTNTKVYEEFETWNHVKLVVRDNAADLYFNSDTPVTHIADLKTDRKTGGLNLRTFSGLGLKKSAYFANFSHRPLKRSDKIIGKSKPEPEVLAGIINRWSVSSSFKERDVQGMHLTDTFPNSLNWQVLDVETNGIANLAKLSARNRTKNTVFVKTVIHSDTAKTIPFTFGYSDRVRLFVNGKFVYGASANYRSRDERFYGTIGLFDTIGLDLKPGENTILAAVSENFGGWGFTAKITDQSGLKITP